jgi:hypothetical protein
VFRQSNDRTFRHSYMAKRDRPAGPSSPWIHLSRLHCCAYEPKDLVVVYKCDSYDADKVLIFRGFSCTWDLPCNIGLYYIVPMHHREIVLQYWCCSHSLMTWITNGVRQAKFEKPVWEGSVWSRCTGCAGCTGCTGSCPKSPKFLPFFQLDRLIISFSFPRSD